MIVFTLLGKITNLAVMNIVCSYPCIKEAVNQQMLTDKMLIKCRLKADPGSRMI